MKCFKLAGTAFGAVLLIASAPLSVVAQSDTPKPSTNQSSNSGSAEDFLSAAQLQRFHDLEAQLKAHEGEIEAKAQELAANASVLATNIQEKIAAALPQDGASISRPGWLGIGIEEVTPDKAKTLNLSAPRGVLGVEPESPAAKAGLRENDVITRYGDQVIEGVVQFRRLVHETPPGRIVALGIWRDGKPANLSIEVGTFRAPGEWPISMRTLSGFRIFDMNTARLGIQAENLSGQLGAYFGAPENEGVLVREVTPGSPADKAGIKAGDVIIKANGMPVHSLADLHEELHLALTLLRKGATMDVTLTVERPQPPVTTPILCLRVRARFLTPAPVRIPTVKNP
jgi:S1-C subfamily serine protease